MAPIDLAFMLLVNFSLIRRIEAQSGVDLEVQRGGERVEIPLYGPP